MTADGAAPIVSSDKSGPQTTIFPLDSTKSLLRIIGERIQCTALEHFERTSHSTHQLEQSYTPHHQAEEEFRLVDWSVQSSFRDTYFAATAEVGAESPPYADNPAVRKP